MAKFIEGPWVAEGHYIAASEKGLRASGISARSNGEIIAEVRPSISGLLTKEQKEATAELMAASPDMVAALKKALPSVCSLTCSSQREGGEWKHSDDCQAVREAIFKAIGERYGDNPSFSMWPVG